MTVDLLKGFGLALLLLLLQVVVLNNIHLFGCATPLLFVYIILLAPNNAPRWAVLLVSFLIGLVSDIFSNTPGVGAASMTLIGFIQPVYLKLFLSRESPEDLQPSLSSLGFSKYLSYSLLLVFLFIVVFFSLEEFTFFHWQQWLLYILGSTLLTYLLIFSIESLRRG